MTPPADGDGGASGAVIHPTILREIGLVQRECTSRHRRTNEEVTRLHGRITEQRADLADHRDRLVELGGRSGTEGKVGELQKDVAEVISGQEAIKVTVTLNASEIAKMKMTQFRWGAGGASVGGGVMFGLVELIKRLF
jgi:hypothetical protein